MLERRLRRTVERLSAPDEPGGSGTDVDDRRVRRPPQPREACLSEHERRPQIDVPVAVELARGDLLERLHRDHRGAVDDDVDPAVQSDRQRYDRLCRVGVAEVSRDLGDLTALGADRGRDVAQAAAIASDQREVVARLGEPDRDTTSNSAAGPGDERRWRQLTSSP